jgi:hypothetical protein
MPTATIETAINNSLLVFPDAFKGIQAIHAET